MALPTNYDSITISVDTNTMNSVAQTVYTSSLNINSDLKDINDSLSGLAVSHVWTGGSASVANDFTTRWNNAMTYLYGTPSDPSTGALNIVIAGLTMAEQNYVNNEVQLTEMFNQWTNPGSSSSGPQQNIKDQVTNTYYHTTSVNETF
jgi:uncharacterized protein YukE